VSAFAEAKVPDVWREAIATPIRNGRCTLGPRREDSMQHSAAFDLVVIDRLDAQNRRGRNLLDARSAAGP
jgi:hypothetical protein